MLIGIVEKNALMQIDFALEVEREQNLTAERAIYEGCLTWFRPIMMTTMAALLGAVPIAAAGAGCGGRVQAWRGGKRRSCVLEVAAVTNLQGGSPDPGAFFSPNLVKSTPSVQWYGRDTVNW